MQDASAGGNRCLTYHVDDWRRIGDEAVMQDGDNAGFARGVLEAIVRNRAAGREAMTLCLPGHQFALAKFLARGLGVRP